MPSIIKQINWVDIFVVILLFRICYIACEHGLLLEVFKILGTISGIYLSLHYYSALSGSIQGAIGLKELSPSIFDLFSVIFLSLAGYLIFSVLRKVFSKIVKMETIVSLNRWGGLVLGVFRGFLLSSLIIFIFVISHIEYLSKSVSNSFSGRYLLNIAPDTYSSLWNGFFSKFMTTEEYNDSITKEKKYLIQEEGSP